MNLLTLLFTAVVVSVDSFVVGFGVSINKRPTTLLPSAVALATLLLCLVTTFIGKSLQLLLQSKVNLLGGCLLFCLGVASLLKREELAPLGALSLKQSLAVGFSVGLDGSIANLSLVAEGFGLIAPLTITLAHFFAVMLGQRLATKANLAGSNRASAFTLMLMAITKLLQ